MELLRSERDGPVAVGGVPQHGEASPDLRDWNDLDALGWHGVYSHTRRTVTVVEQDLNEQATEGVAHDDRWALQLAYDTLVVLHDCGDRQRLDRGGVLVQRLHLYLQTGVGRSEHAIAAALVALDPALPASWGHPEPMDQDDGVWSTRIRGVVLGGHDGLLSQHGQLAKRPERGSDFLREQPRLLPGGEVAALVDLVEVDQAGVGLLGPAARGLVLLAGKDTHGDRNGDALGVEEAALVFPIETRRRDPRVRQPIESDVVEDLVARQFARGACRPVQSGDDRRRRLAVGVVVVEKPSCEADG